MHHTFQPLRLRALATRKRTPSTTWTGLASALVLCACALEPEDPLSMRQSTWSADALVGVSLGESTTCATTATGQAKCWGRADDGRLGQGQALGTIAADPTALEPLVLGDAATMVVTNGAQSFALLGDGSVRAFGLNDAHQLGLSHAWNVGDDETPANATVPTLVPLAAPALQLVAGQGFACARLATGRVQCWGRGDEGQLGQGVQSGAQPPSVVALDTAALELTAGAAHACALLSTGAVRCWGSNDRGQLGQGSLVDVPLGGVATRVAAGGAHTCARLESGAIRCWGDNDHGQLGQGHADPLADAESPIDVPLGGAVTQVVAGLRHTCALLDDGRLRCWGDGVALGLDLGSDENVLEATPIELGEREVVEVFAGPLAKHSCALLDDGSLRCWGLDDHGQVGLGYISPQDPIEGPPGDLPDVIIVEDPDA